MLSKSEGTEYRGLVRRCRTFWSPARELCSGRTPRDSLDSDIDRIRLPVPLHTSKQCAQLLEMGGLSPIRLDDPIHDLHPYRS